MLLVNVLYGLRKKAITLLRFVLVYLKCIVELNFC